MSFRGYGPFDWALMVVVVAAFPFLYKFIPAGWSDKLEKWLDQKLGLGRFFPPDE